MGVPVGFLRSLRHRSDRDDATTTPPSAPAAVAAASDVASNRTADIGDAVRSLGSYHEGLRTRCETTLSIVRTFRSVSDEIESLFDSFGEMAERAQAQSKTLIETTASLAQKKELAEVLSAEIRGLTAQTTQLSTQVEGLSAAKTASEAHVSTLMEQLKATQTELKERAAAQRLGEIEFSAARTTVAKLEEELGRLSAKLKDAEKAIADGQDERRMLRERLMFETEERGKLSKAHEELVSATTLRKREHMEIGSQLEQARALIADTEARLNIALAEAEKLKEELRSSQTAHQEDSYSSKLQADAVKSRSRLTEQLLEKARDEVRRVQQELSQFEEAKRRLIRIEATNVDLASQLDARNRQIVELERGRDAIAERADELTVTVREKQALNEKAAERIRLLQEAQSSYERDRAKETVELKTQLARVLEQLEKERSDRAFIEGALQIARRDRTQLQTLVARNKHLFTNAPGLALVEADAASSADLQDKLRADSSNVEPLHPEPSAADRSGAATRTPH